MMKQWIIDNVDISTVRRCFKCGVPINPGTGVYVSALDGKIYPYTTTNKDTYVGIAEDAGATNKFIDVVTHGYLKVPGSGWSAGLAYYVNAGGGLTAGSGDMPTAVGYGEDAIIVYAGKGTDAVIVLGAGNLSSVRKCSNNSSSGDYSTVLGSYNTGSGAFSSVLGGFCNTSSNSYSTILNGGCHVSSGYFSLVGNGSANSATNCHSVVLAGTSNISCGPHSTILNGVTNTASALYAASLTGSLNLTSQPFATIVSGINNSASAYMTGIFLGKDNVNCTNFSVINNGVYNRLINSNGACFANWSFIGNGVGGNTTGGTWSPTNCAFTALPTTTNPGCYSFIGTGFQNRAEGLFSSVVNGCCNYAKTQNAFIGNGIGNSTDVEQYQFIGNGLYNNVAQRFSTIVNGLTNTISGRYNFIGNGDCNSITGAIRSFIGSGNANTINIAGFTGHSAIGSGVTNTISERRSFIGSGRSNIVSGQVSSIVSGCTNTVSNHYASILGGCTNTVTAYYSAIAGGASNSIKANVSGSFGCNSFIGNGNCNNICLGNFSFIGSGAGNNTTGGTWNGSAFTVAPTICNAGNYSFIGSGFQNATSGCHSSIVSGKTNTASACYSAILNGLNNVVSGAFSAASGCGLTAACACTFYTNNSCACGTVASSTLTPGTAVCVTAGGVLSSYSPVGGITLYYGAFSSNATQTATNPNQEYLMTLNTTALSNGVSISGSQITIANAGIYNIQFSAQIKHTSGGAATIDIWFKKNGTNIPDSDTKVIAPNNTEEVAAWNLVESFTAGQYVELAWSTSVGGTQLLATAAQTGPTRPAIPSLIVTVTRVG
jgi:hypothetical protein